MEIGSARVPRASSGVAPELLSHTLPGISGAKKFARRIFRRDAEKHVPEARAPQNAPPNPPSISEFGLKLENIEHRTPNIEHRMARACLNTWMFGVRCSMFPPNLTLVWSPAFRRFWRDAAQRRNQTLATRPPPLFAG